MAAEKSRGSSQIQQNLRFSALFFCGKQPLNDTCFLLQSAGNKFGISGILFVTFVTECLSVAYTGTSIRHLQKFTLPTRSVNMNRIKTVAVAALLLGSNLPVILAQWLPLNSGSSARYESLYFFDANNGLASSTANVIRTSNGGSTWTTVSVNGIRDIDFIDANNGFAAGYSSQALKKTTNGGASWSPLTPVNSNSLWGISVVSTSTVYASGTGGVVWRSTNGGLSFTPVNLPTVSDLAVDLQFLNATTGCVLGQPGDIWRTTNSGASWTKTHTTPSVASTSIYFVNATTGFAVGSGGWIIKTTDGGISWTTLNSGSTAYLQYVHFYDVNNGITAGIGGVILRTTDGGATWQQEISGTTEDLYSCILLSPTVAIVGGNNGTLLKNTNLQTVGAHEPELNWTLSASPNPCSGAVTIDLGASREQVTAVVSDISGSVVRNETFHQTSSLNLNLEGPAGIYFISLISDDRRAMIKVVKE